MWFSSAKLIFFNLKRCVCALYFCSWLGLCTALTISRLPVSWLCFTCVRGVFPHIFMLMWGLFYSPLLVDLSATCRRQPVPAGTSVWHAVGAGCYVVCRSVTIRRQLSVFLRAFRLGRQLNAFHRAHPYAAQVGPVVVRPHVGADVGQMHLAFVE